MFPLHNGPTPSSAIVLLKQSTTPLYGSASLPCLIISSWFWTKSLIRSIGAAAVLETTAATPESMKFSPKDKLFPFFPMVVLVLDLYFRLSKILPI